MAGNDTLKRANKAKKDEFYTRLTDIEKEMRHYKKHFAGKTVLCNCDDPFESNFFKYFVLNFNRLGLKKLIATCYIGSPIANRQLSLFDVFGENQGKQNRPYKAVVTTVYDKTGDGTVDMLDIAELFKSGENELTELKGDGDFCSEECLALMDEADIVVTNPPFSLFRKYIATLMEYRKQFIVVGNKNAVTYKEFFPLLMKNEVWVGARSMNQDFWLFVPDGEPYEKVDEDGKHIKHIIPPLISPSRTPKTGGRRSAKQLNPFSAGSARAIFRLLIVPTMSEPYLSRMGCRTFRSIVSFETPMIKHKPSLPTRSRILIGMTAVTST